MSEGRPSRAPVDAWQANQLRLTFFATPDALPLQTEGWWEAVTGAAPERIEDKPKLGQHLEEGSFLDAQLTLNVAANRIDWVLGPIIDPEHGLADMPSIGPFVPIRDQFTAGMPDLDTSRTSSPSPGFRSPPVPSRLLW